MTGVLGALGPGTVAVTHSLVHGTSGPAILSLTKGRLTPIPIAPYGNPPLSFAANRVIVGLASLTAFGPSPRALWHGTTQADSTFGAGAIVGLQGETDPATGAAVLVSPVTGQTLFARPLLPPSSALSTDAEAPDFQLVAVACSGNVAYELAAGVVHTVGFAEVQWLVTALDLESDGRLWQRDLHVPVSPSGVTALETDPVRVLHMAAATPQGVTLAFSGRQGLLVTLAAGTGRTVWSLGSGPIGTAVTNGDAVAVQGPDGGTVTIRSATSGRLERTLRVGGGRLLWASRGALLLSQGADLRSLTWQGRTQRTFPGPGPEAVGPAGIDEGPAGVFAFVTARSPQGQIAGVGLEKIAEGVQVAVPPPTVRWRVTGRLGLRGTIVAVAMAPDGSELAAATRDPDAVTLVDVRHPAHIEARVALPAAPAALVWPDGPDPVATLAPCAEPGTLCAGQDRTEMVTAAGAIPVPTGAGSLALTPVPGQDAVLVAASGAGTVSEVALSGSRPRVVRSFAVGTGALTAVAANASGSLAAVANATAGEVTVLDLATGRIQTQAQVSYVPDALVFLPGTPYLAVGERRGENVALVNVTDGTVPMAPRVAGFSGPVVVSGALSFLVAGSLQDQGISEIPFVSVATPRGGRSLQSVPLEWVPLGPPASGAVSGLALAAGGREALSTSAHGLAVAVLGQARIAQRLVPSELGGVPSLLTVSAGGTVALVASQDRVAILRSEAGGS